MRRLLLVLGILAASSGAAGMLPAITAWQERGTFEWQVGVVFSLALLLLLGGAFAIWRGLRRPPVAPIPAPVRAVIAGNLFFLAFCALETSDRFVRQGGRMTYWTTLLYLPALVLLVGLLRAQRWAWWVARGVTALATLWFVAFLAMVPFVHLTGNGGSVPWWGRIYVAGVTLVFAGISAYAFWSLGRDGAREYFGIKSRAASLLPERS
ncbi:MAG: hypothetical protein HY301_00550 [Verrucomicrobia bacterium]|nr:hypothetical protein [Verrucomicrobiota bacterium]